MMPDQAEGIRQLQAAVASEARPASRGGLRRHARVVAVTSGKGGVGKTSLASNIAVAAASRGRRVLLVDVDLGLANVDIILGVQPRYNLAHFISGRRRLEEIVVRGPGGVLLVPGANGIAQLADLDAAARERVIHGLNELETQVDLIIIDTGAGIGPDVLSFTSTADDVLVVITPDPASLTDGYAVVKSIWLTGRRTGFRLALNMTRSAEEALAVAGRIHRVMSRFLDGQEIVFTGAVPFDACVQESIRARQPFVLAHPRSPAAKAVRQLAGRLMRSTRHESAARRAAYRIHPPLAPRAGFFRRLTGFVIGHEPSQDVVGRREAG